MSATVCLSPVTQKADNARKGIKTEAVDDLHGLMKGLLRKQTMLGRALRRFLQKEVNMPYNNLRKQTMLGRALRPFGLGARDLLRRLRLRKQTMLGRALRL